MRPLVICTLLGLAGRAALAAAQESPAPELTAFSGTWTLNRELSDDDAEKMRESAERGGPGRFGPGAGGPPPGLGDAPEGIRAIFEPAEELVIGVRAGELEIEESFVRTRRLRPNGKTYKAENGLAEVEARWEEGALRVKTKHGRGGKVEETWTLFQDRNRIQIDLELDMGPGPDLELRRVYDRAPADAGG
jgi:hypothetical protein